MERLPDRPVKAIYTDGNITDTGDNGVDSHADNLKSNTNLKTHSPSNARRTPSPNLNNTTGHGRKSPMSNRRNCPSPKATGRSTTVKSSTINIYNPNSNSTNTGGNNYNGFKTSNIHNNINFGGMGNNNNANNSNNTGSAGFVGLGDKTG